MYSKLPRSVVGLVIFGGIVLPYSLYKRSDSWSKLRLSHAWCDNCQKENKKKKKIIIIIIILFKINGIQFGKLQKEYLFI